MESGRAVQGHHYQGHLYLDTRSVYWKVAVLSKVVLFKVDITWTQGRYTGEWPCCPRFSLSRLSLPGHKVGVLKSGRSVQDCFNQGCHYLDTRLVY